MDNKTELEHWKERAEAAEAALKAASEPSVDNELNYLRVPISPRLHKDTAELVAKFAFWMANKLTMSQQKYGYSNGWKSPDWMDECRAKLVEHLAKGDPVDVANYCAFLHWHGESTSPIPAPREWVSLTDQQVLDESRPHMEWCGQGDFNLAHAIEAKCKELNNHG